MSFRNILIALFLSLLSSAQAANIVAIKQGVLSVSDFFGGLDDTKIHQCRKIADINRQANPSCLQTNDIISITGFSPDVVKRCGNVDVFSITHTADAIPSYYLVDLSGEMIDIDNFPFLKIPIIATNANVTLTTQIESWQCRKLSNGIQQIILGQELKEGGGCVGCTQVAVANIAFEFSPQGKFLNSKLISIK